MNRPAQNHDGYTLALTAPDGTVVGRVGITFSDSVFPDGTAGDLYVQNGEAAGVMDELVALASSRINGEATR